MIELGTFYDIPLTRLPDCHWGYLMKHGNGQFKVGITSEPQKRFASYTTHNPDIVLAYIECFPSKAWATWWEKNVMFFSGGKEWLGDISRWFPYVCTGYGRHIGIYAKNYKEIADNIEREMKSEIARRNGACPDQIQMLARCAGAI